MYSQYPQVEILSQEFIWCGRQEHRGVISGRNHAGLSWLGRLALGVDFLASELSLLLEVFVGHHAGQEVLTALRVVDVLHSDIDPDEQMVSLMNGTPETPQLTSWLRSFREPAC